MISRRTSSIPKEDVVFLRLLYCDSRCSQTCHWHSQACRRHSQTCCWHSQTCRRHSQTYPQHTQHCCRHSQACRQCSLGLSGAPKVLSGAPRCSQTYHNHSGTPVVDIRDPSYAECQMECPPRVWYSLEIDASKFTLHILTNTPGGFQWLKYIVLMWRPPSASPNLLDHSLQIDF